MFSDEHVPTNELRHNCTNYDQLREASELARLNELERSRVICVIKYECTSKVLQRRAGVQRERQIEAREHLLEAEAAIRRRDGIIEALRRFIFGNEKEIEHLKAKIAALEASSRSENTISQESNNNLEYEKEIADYKKALAKAEKKLAEAEKEAAKAALKYEQERQKRIKGGKKRQILGGKISWLGRIRKERDKLRNDKADLSAQLDRAELLINQLQKEINNLKAR